MRILNVVQGSPEWLAVRAQYNTASEAPAMMGVSKNMSRDELLRQKKTGITPDVDSFKQALFAKGHATEATARVIVEQMIGEDLSPITAVSDDGTLLASLDGATMMTDALLEHKLWSESLAAQVRAGNLEPHYYWQLEQELLVTGAEKVIFVTSDGTREKFASMEYFPVAGRAKQLVDGWIQFAKDLAAYVPPEVIVPAVAAPQMGLPAVLIKVEGSIALVDNLPEIGVALNAYIERINRKPETDQDFANLEATVKNLQAFEKALTASEENAIAQVGSVDAMRKTVALYRELASSNRILVGKLVDAEKANRKTKIVSDAVAALHSHLKALNDRTRNYMPQVPNQFQEVIKGLKSIDSMKAKVDAELARCKIEANAIADKIGFNLELLDENTEFGFLFPDAAQMVLKAADDFTALVNSRIAAHKAAEAAKEAAFEQLERDETARLAKLNATVVVEAAPAPAALAPALTHTQVVQQMPATVRQAMAPKPAAAPTMSLGEISTKLGFNVTSVFLASLGYEATTVRAAKLYHEEDFPAIGKAIIEHIETVCELQAA